MPRLNAPMKICYLPHFESVEEFDYYHEQAAWHLAPLDKSCEVHFFCGPAIEIASAKPNFICQNAGQAPSSAGHEYDYVFFWKKAAYWSAPAKTRQKAIIVDEYAEQAVGDKLDQFVSEHYQHDIAQDEMTFRNLVSTFSNNFGHVNIIGSGGSLNIERASRHRGANVYLGTAIFITEMTKSYTPHIIIAADGPSQFSLSKTAQRFRETVIAFVRKHGTYVIIPYQHLPGIFSHWPEDIFDKIISVPKTAKVPFGNTLTQKWAYEPTSNVLTSLGLPTACCISPNIHFHGITLPNIVSNNDDTTHWVHLDEASYQRHVAPIIARHPASIVDHPSYFSEHTFRLGKELHAYTQAQISFKNEKGDPLRFSEAPARAANRKNLTTRLFHIIEILQHRPVVLILAFAAFIIALGKSLELLAGAEMTFYIFLGLNLSAMLALVLFIRLRMNRMTSELETRLSQQQAHQFNNLSKRLQALEDEV